MPTRPYILVETNWKTVSETPYEVAILPWGATEAHNWHLPYATDVLQCDVVAAEAARRAWDAGASVIVLPTIPFGVNTGQRDIKLDINMNPSTQAAVLRDVVDSLNAQQIHKLVLLNGHGGNDFRQMIREIGVDYPAMFISALNWYRAADGDVFFDEPGDHAGEMETSMMLHIAPHLVLPLEEAGKGKARPFKIQALREGWAWAEREWSKVSEDTGVGNPKHATAEKGERYLHAVAENIARFLIDLAKSDLDDLYE
ncbi:MAG TPA: creatininase family protein [Rhodothermales bacterium]|nr:creatininase family protein [Rhodothermales bacterium]